MLFGLYSATKQIIAVNPKNAKQKLILHGLLFCSSSTTFESARIHNLLIKLILIEETTNR
jgi:hypothetical protein